MLDLTLAICIYNAEAYIEQTLHSVVSQTKQDFHLLLVDDHSTDSGVSKAESYLVAVGRQYELVRFDHNMGIGYARHFAERRANTRFMMFLDADDYLLPDAIQKMYSMISVDSDLMAVGCYLDYVDKAGKKIGGGLYLGDTDKDAFLSRAQNRKLIFMQPAAIYDRELALKVGGYVIDGFPEGSPRWQDFCEDLDLWTRMSDLYVYGKAIIVIPEVLCHYRKAGGLSSNTYYMLVKMRYTKSNLIRRRDGQDQLSFIDFYAQMSDKEKGSLQGEAHAADSLRNGVMAIRDGHLFRGTMMVASSFFSSPSYFFSKIKHNLFRRK